MMDSCRADMDPASGKRRVFTWYTCRLFVTYIETRRLANAGFTLGRRPRRWPNMNSALGKRVVFTTCKYTVGNI